MTAGESRHPRYFRSGALIAAIILGLFTIDRVLGKLEQLEVQGEASTQYQAGLLAARKGNYAAALTAMRRAHALARTTRAYSIGLGEALIAKGNTSEAESVLREVLSADSNDGKANLLMARLLAGRANVPEAIAFFHRAIYGTWHPNNAAAAAVRMELAEYLAHVQRPQELLAELLLIEERAERDPALARRLAPLFLASGSGPRAAAMYRIILREKPGDEQASIGLGEASLLSGDYREAESMFLSALRHSSDNPEIIHRLKFANELAMLDPTPRRLSSGAKYERAMTLLTHISRQVSKCQAASSPTQPIDIDVKQALASKAGGRITNELAESRLALAERLWEVQEERCPPSTSGADDETAIVMRKLKRTQ